MDFRLTQTQPGPCIIARHGSTWMVAMLTSTKRTLPLLGGNQLTFFLFGQEARINGDRGMGQTDKSVPPCHGVTKTLIPTCESEE